MRIISNIFILALGLFVLAGISIFSNHESFASRVIILAFWVLTVATIQYILEIRNEK